MKLTTSEINALSPTLRRLPVSILRQTNPGKGMYLLEVYHGSRVEFVTIHWSNRK